MLGKAVTVHEHDGSALQACIARRPQVFAQAGFIERQNHLAMRANALVRFHHAFIQQLGQHDMALKQARTVLVGNTQRIAKTARGDEQRRLALALQQRVGGHGGAHLHALHQLRRDRCASRQAQQVPDARHSRIGVLLGVVR